LRIDVLLSKHDVATIFGLIPKKLEPWGKVQANWRSQSTFRTHKNRRKLSTDHFQEVDKNEINDDVTFC
jgi:hypothetical protein